MKELGLWSENEPRFGHEWGWGTQNHFSSSFLSSDSCLNIALWGTTEKYCNGDQVRRMDCIFSCAVHTAGKIRGPRTADETIREPNRETGTVHYFRMWGPPAVDWLTPLCKEKKDVRRIEFFREHATSPICMWYRTRCSMHFENNFRNWFAKEMVTWTQCLIFFAFLPRSRWMDEWVSETNRLIQDQMRADSTRAPKNSWIQFDY